MGSIFSKPSSPPTIIQQPVTREEGPSADDIAKEERMRRNMLARRQGRGSTILGGGVGDDLNGKSLLGQ